MQQAKLISDQGLRLDGRRPHELRRIQCKLGVFSQPDGSAYIEQGNTKVLATVYGPHQISTRRQQQMTSDDGVINCQYSMATFSTSERKARPRGDRKSQEMQSHIQQALSATIRMESYPRCQIDVFIEVLQADGGNFCASLNAATLALIDAGINLTEYCCACTASLGNGDIPLVDVSHLEEACGGATLTVACLPSSNKIAFMEMSQRFHLDHLQKVIEQAIEGCKGIFAVLDAAVRDHIQKMGAASDWDNFELNN